MLIETIAAAQALFYLCAIPVHAAVRLDGGEAGPDGELLSVGAGVSAFDRNAARLRARRKLERPKRKRGGGPDARDATRVLRRLRLTRASLRGTVGLGDAAASALAAGALNGVFCALAGTLGRADADVRPDFASDRPRVALEGMASALSGQIMLALIRAEMDRLRGKLAHGQKASD